MGLRLIRDLPGAPGFLATVAHDACASARDTSVGVSGPRDFAVRLPSFVRAHHARCDENRPPHPTQRFVTFAKAPLDRAGCADMIMTSVKKKQKYFSLRDWTGQISLRSRVNFTCWRMRLWECLSCRRLPTAAQCSALAPCGRGHLGTCGKLGWVRGMPPRVRLAETYPSPNRMRGWATHALSHKGRGRMNWDRLRCGIGRAQIDSRMTRAESALPQRRPA